MHIIALLFMWIVCIIGGVNYLKYSIFFSFTILPLGVIMTATTKNKLVSTLTTRITQLGAAIENTGSNLDEDSGYVENKESFELCLKLANDIGLTTVKEAIQHLEAQDFGENMKLMMDALKHLDENPCELTA